MSLANKTFLAALLFLSIQFMSMVGGVQFIATMQYFAVDVATGLPQNVARGLDITSGLPHEDMSLEHVVPLDPFLGGTAAGADLARFGSQANLLCAVVFSLLALLALKTPRNRLEFSPVISRQTHKLWLFKRSLRI